MGSEPKPLAACLGRVLAEDVKATHELPPFANSSMDGYAVRAEDVTAASEEGPVTLQVVGDAAAGSQQLPEVGEGQAARITTGAPLPPGADAVVPVEMTDKPEPMAGQELVAEIQIKSPVTEGAYVRPSGQDVKKDSVVIPSGQRLRPQDLGMLAALGVERPVVRRQPKVAILSTGDEVVEVSSDLLPGQIRDANGYTVAGFAESSGAQPLRLGIAADTEDSVEQHLESAVESEADLILSTAGVSMGAHDYVRKVLQKNGELAFWRVNIRPGKPLAFGSYRGIPFLGLPGNPVSAWVTFAVFVQPVLRALLGMGSRRRLTVEAELAEAVQSDGRESYLRAHLWTEGEGYRVRLTGSQDSGVMSSLIEANGLLLLPSGVRRMEQGASVEVWLMGVDGMLYVD